MAFSSFMSVAASPGGVVHGVVLMKGMLDATAFARRVTNPGLACCKFCDVKFEDVASVGAVIEAVVGPDVAAANRAAFLALGRGKARRDGALDAAASSYSSVAARWSGGTALAGGTWEPNWLVMFSPGVISGVPG